MPLGAALQLPSPRLLSSRLLGGHRRHASRQLFTLPHVTACRWAGTFQMPWDWRASRTTSPTPSPSPRDPTCLIKGNISSAGKIYHVPGSAFYDRTDVDESKGERWFCTVEEAEAAGWRAPA